MIYNYNTSTLSQWSKQTINDNVEQEQDVILGTSGWIDGAFDPVSGDGSVGPLVFASRGIPHIKGKKNTVVSYLSFLSVVEKCKGTV